MINWIKSFFCKHTYQEIKGVNTTLALMLGNVKCSKCGKTMFSQKIAELNEIAEIDNKYL